MFPSATTGHSCPVDPPRQIEPDSSLERAVMEREVGEALPRPVPGRLPAPLSLCLSCRSSCVLGPRPEGVALLEASSVSPVFSPLHTLPLWGDLECPSLSPGQRIKGGPKRHGIL